MGERDIFQIGDVAERVGLSLRTMRYYEEVGLVPPSDRSPGGFRLYTESDIAQLELIKQLKPLGFSLDQMRELLDLRRRLQADDGISKRALAQLRRYAEDARERCHELRAQLRAAEQLANQLEADLDARDRQQVG
ncbi:MAG: MerR family transcriptional regulator [Actinobacteria bacterium]|nr:MerR family transcriptional regulator [Actinomycetota bacterium]